MLLVEQVAMVKMITTMPPCPIELGAIIKLSPDLKLEVGDLASQANNLSQGTYHVYTSLEKSETGMNCPYPLFFDRWNINN
jgi:hypothetical protein